MSFPDLYVVLLPLAYLAGIGLALVAISQDRTPQGAIAWAIALIAMPFIAIPAFFVFGGWRYRAYRRARLRSRQRLPRDPDWLPDTSQLERRQLGELRVLEKLARIPFTRGNSLNLLVDGKETFDALFAAIDSAEKYVLCQFYIVRDDSVGNALAERLQMAARRGVRVCLLYDEVGSISTPGSYFNRLIADGVSVYPFGSAYGFGRRFQINFRNHRKVLVVDGKQAFTGGINAADEYVGGDPDLSPWRDTHLGFRGPSVMAAQLAFAEDWFWASGEKLELDWESANPRPEDQSALLIASGPADPVETYGLLTIQAITSAVERIWIATPYFIPDRALVMALQLAVLRGVDVRVIVPRKRDNLLAGLANYAWFEKVSSEGVRLFRYRDGFMHQKVMLVDNAFAAIGSANLDNRSFNLNFEITMLVADRAFAGSVEKMLLNDLDKCDAYDRIEYRRSPFYFKMAVRIAHLFSPLL